MFGWLKELLEIRIEYKAKQIELASTKNSIDISRAHDTKLCESCETLKMQLAIANQEKKELLNRILTPVTAVKPEVIIQNPRAVIPPRHSGFNTKRRELELASKENRRLLDEKAREESKLKAVGKSNDDIDDLEQELDLAAANREAQSGVK